MTVRRQLAIPTALLKLPFKDSLIAAARLGASGVQLDLRNEVSSIEWTSTALRDCKHFASELGIKLAVGTFPLKRSLADKEHLEKRVLAIRGAMTLARQFGMSVLTLCAGTLPAPEQVGPRRILHDVLSDLARHADHVGVSLCLTPAGESPAAMLELINSVEIGPLAVDFDPSTIDVKDSTPVEALRQLHAVLGHVSLVDLMRNYGGTAQKVVVGRGSLPWIELLATLDEIGFQGWQTCLSGPSDDPASDLRAAIKYIANLFPTF
jgi:sugar phosphate isomerase/epimerase